MVLLKTQPATVENNGAMPIYWYGGQLQITGSRVLSTRTSKDPFFLAATTVGADTRQGYDSLPTQSFMSAVFAGGVADGGNHRIRLRHCNDHKCCFRIDLDSYVQLSLLLPFSLNAGSSPVGGALMEWFINSRVDPIPGGAPRAR